MLRELEKYIFESGAKKWLLGEKQHGLNGIVFPLMPDE